jgi:hypothetical protein
MVTMCEAYTCLANICLVTHKHTSANAQAQTHELGDMPRARGYIHRYSVFVWIHSRFCWGSVLSDAPWRACRRLWWGRFVGDDLSLWVCGWFSCFVWFCSWVVGNSRSEAAVVGGR